MIVEIPKCACGEPMMPAVNDNYFICDNCDTVQDIENQVVGFKDGLAVKGRRLPTSQDNKYEKTMKSRMQFWYE